MEPNTQKKQRKAEEDAKDAVEALLKRELERIKSGNSNN